MKTKLAMLATMVLGVMLIISCSNASGGSSSKSSDSTLSSLVIEVGSSPVTLNKTFSPSSLTYTANVSNDVSSVTISATATDSLASVTGAGVKSLSPGSNTEHVLVSAEDGTTKTYSIVITRADYSVGITSPVDCSSISTPLLTVTGNYYNKSNTPPSTITVSYCGTAIVNAKINTSSSTWEATIDASKIGNTGTGRMKTLRTCATWSDGDVQNAYASYSFSGGVTSYSISGTVSLPTGVNMEGKKVSVYIEGNTLWTSGGIDLADYKSTSLSYTLHDVPNGSYAVKAYTYPDSGDGSYTHGSYYEPTWTGTSVSVVSSDVTGVNIVLTTYNP